ncbi:hypothetical protein [Brevundimonas vesicularis]|uniref:Uncharacterized protein n=1 Tax=Brevundimonas vesicularis TaxID=41276 RepID=A0A1Z3U7A9_BREVE|nr:hypothetical protein [Brevundimonas vesicularis]ASE39122.1 hypothetical protein CEP68_06195 [Brevundimonas vesicularis]
MTDIAITDPRRAVGAASKPTRQQTVARSLKAIHDTHLSIWTDYADMLATFEDARRDDHWQGGFLQLPIHRHFQPENEVQRENAIRYLSEHVERQPDLTKAGAILDRVEAAFEQGFHEAQVRVIIGLMVDAFPNARPHSPEAYVETLIHELSHQGATTAAIAKGCNAITLTAKFLPAASEVLEKVKSCAGVLAHIRRTLMRYTEWSATTAEAVVWLQTQALWDRTAGERLEFEGNDPF